MEEFTKLIDKTAELNNIGIGLEKAGKTDDAIKVYEENILMGQPATHSYERLMILYKKREDTENEVRVIKLAIDVFSKENIKRYERALKEHPEKNAQIIEAFKSETRLIGENGWYFYVPYEVNKYRKRLSKIL